MAWGSVIAKTYNFQENKHQVYNNCFYPFEVFTLKLLDVVCNYTLICRTDYKSMKITQDDKQETCGVRNIQNKWK